jgi:hypothetical protein
MTTCYFCGIDIKWYLLHYISVPNKPNKVAVCNKCHIKEGYGETI